MGLTVTWRQVAASGSSLLQFSSLYVPSITGSKLLLHRLDQPGGILFIGSFFLVESPRWLVSRDRNSQALKNLIYLRHLPRDHPYLIEEYRAIEATIAHERGLAGAGFFGPFKTVFGSNVLIKRLLIGASLFAWQKRNRNKRYQLLLVCYYFRDICLAYPYLLYSSPTIFRSIGVNGTSTALLTTGVYGISMYFVSTSVWSDIWFGFSVKLVGALIWIYWLVDTLGRRYLLIVGSIGGALSMYYIGAYIAISKPTTGTPAEDTPLSRGGISASAFRLTLRASIHDWRIPTRWI